MPLNPIRNFECEILAYMPEDRIMMINSKLDHLQKLKSNGDKKPIINYYIQELNRMKNDAYKYPIYSHLGVYIPETDFSWYVTFNNINDQLWWIYKRE